jgi:putative ABC transport system permease protein
MRSARWQKLVGDVSAERGRLALMGTALMVSLIAVGTVLGAWAVLTREIAANYLSTVPASATLELPDGVDEALLRDVRASGLVADAEAREVSFARAQVGDAWRPVLLFEVADFNDLRLNRFTRESGEWPPGPGSVLVERSALGMAGGGTTLTLKTPHGTPTTVPIVGLVHDPGLAPAWQEREVYAYATRETVRQLGESGVLHELRVRFAPEPMTVVEAEQGAARLGRWLEARGVSVHEARVPPPRQHPHQRQMTTILLLLLIFAGLSLVLSSVLVATTLSAMLARQVREIGVMKTLGARASQLGGLYAVLVGALGLVAWLGSVPLALVGTGLFARAVSTMLNFNLTSQALPWWVFATGAVAGVVVPLAFALVPIRGAVRVSVREALEAHGVVSGVWVPRWLPVTARSLLRRPKRLALTVLLLATAGALFMTALGVARAWERNLDKIYETRHYDVELRLHRPPGASLQPQLLAVPGVTQVEWWGYAPAAFSHEGQLDTVRTYPDRGHGSLMVLAPPANTKLVSFPVLQGRWLLPEDTDAVVLNHVAAAQAGGVTVGAPVTLAVEGHHHAWRVVGVVEEIGAAGVAYVNAPAFERLEGPSRFARLVTASATPTERTQVIHRLEDVLARASASIEVVIPFSELRTAIGDHVVILIRALLALATILGVVGLLGLSSAMGVSVLERTRELGVMKAVGASGRRIARQLNQEALLTAVMSWFAAVLLSLPLTATVERFIGQLGFLAPLPFVLAPWGIAGWLALVVLASLIATSLPARRAAALSVREALAQV